MNAKEAARAAETGQLDETIARLYCCEGEKGKERADRLARAARSFESQYGESREIGIFSAPGRTEIGGNHTDHQGGHVLAAAVNLDAVAVAAPSGDDTVRVKSEGFPEDAVSLSRKEPQDAERNTSAALIRGICAGFQALGYPVGGFRAWTTSDVLSGSGLSSSAAFEVLIGTVVNGLFCGGEVEPLAVAQIGRRAENVYFGKPSGLMDQAASAVGGFTVMDFGDAGHPKAERIPFDFETCGDRLCIIDTKGSHSDLTPDYAAIPAEMREVAGYFGKDLLSEVKEKDFFAELPNLRRAAGDRAVLRAFHYFEDDRRVLREAEALRNHDFAAFKKLVIESGRSSFQYLQNVYSPSQVKEQGVSLALALCEKLLAPRGGAWRVHGGGFAGTVQAYVPGGYLGEFTEKMESVFGKGACHTLSVRPDGGVRVL